MTTHRSLNKLEFKAHMSIHNKVEVVDGETHDSNYTRDRFGKNHRISDSDGSSRIRRKKKTAFALILLPVAGLLVSVDSVYAGSRSTDVKVESQGLDQAFMDQKLNPPEERFAFYRDNEKSVDINEDGDPNMNFRF